MRFSDLYGTTLLDIRKGIAACMILILAGCGGEKSAPAASAPGGPAPALAVKVAIIQPRVLNNTIASTGTLLANEEVELRSEISGRITRINFQEGQTVPAGKVLVNINDSELQAQLKKSLLREEQLADDEARRKQLLDLKSISEEEYEQAYNQLQLARSETELIRSQLEKTVIEAPFSGRIGLRGVSQGGFVTPASPIALLQQLDPIKIEFSIPEKYSQLLQPGAMVTFFLNGEKTPHQASVYAVESKIDAETRTLRVRARCANPGGHMVPGSFARIELTLSRIPEALLIPAEAIIPDASGEKVLLMRGGKAVSTPITTGTRTEREVQVTNGIKPGDTLITTGLMLLRPGAPVQIQEVVTSAAE
ncbi:MAG: efflux RND transporter periplasmic adaptor subunit [Bacteroidia bacterium]|nr:efflux RND transporter periplasmic adaptor subunit [Bacteroidia bacterium]